MLRFTSRSVETSAVLIGLYLIWHTCGLEAGTMEAKNLFNETVKKRMLYLVIRPSSSAMATYLFEEIFVVCRVFEGLLIGHTTMVALYVLLLI